MDVIESFEYQLVRWLINNDITNIDVNFGIDFCYYKDTHIINYSLFSREICDKEFERFFYEYGCHHSVSVFTISFLHEVGHAMTLAAFSDEECNSLIDMVESAREAICLNSKVEECFNLDWYWHMPHEFAANIWAINFINNHFDEVRELEEIIENSLDKIYADDEIISALDKLLNQLKEEDDNN